MKQHDNTVPPKENDKFSATKPKDRECYNLTDKQFKMAFMKKFNELEKNQEGNTMTLGIKLMNRRSTLPKD